jgi:bifunctional non-homologous end joining protein LigD
MTSVLGVTLSNPDRILYPEQGITKLDLARYYAAVAPRMLPHLAGRLLALVRCPSGRQKACFYQKHWSGRLPVGVKTVKIREARGTVREYTYLESAQGLVALVQNGVLEFHVWGSRVDQLENPDRMVFDLDPAPEVSWSRTREAAREMRELLQAVRLESWVKTTGGKGLHVVVPLDRRAGWQAVSAFARTVAFQLAAQRPRTYLARASQAERAGRIFVDWLRNTRGATSIAPWSTRAREGAPVSVPVSWEDLGRVRSGDQFTIAKVGGLVARGYSDPWAGLLRAGQPLP